MLLDVEEDIAVVEVVDEVPQDRGLKVQAPMEVESGSEEVA